MGVKEGKTSHRNFSHLPRERRSKNTQEDMGAGVNKYVGAFWLPSLKRMALVLSRFIDWRVVFKFYALLTHQSS